jgi:hypothetical protein
LASLTAICDSPAEPYGGILIKQNEGRNQPEIVEQIALQKEALHVVPTDKKTFVEPAISTPVDVLEVTTFFQGATSGVTIP